MKAKITLHREFSIGEVDKRLFGSFIEHLGRAVYSGLYEPGHPEADSGGFRKDVAALVRELDVSVIRYPGGNFVSGYRWEDGVGLRGSRPKCPDLAWRSLETNQIGTDEFALWTKKAGAQLMLAVNLGTRGIADACNLLEYCNLEAGTLYSDLRRSNGHEAPHRVPVWCLGNEMDGAWQVGRKTAGEYGRLAQETARAMRKLDSDIELVACGSSSAKMPSFPEWEAEVLRHTYEDVDYISLHQYFGNDNDDPADFLAQTLEQERFIRTVVSVCDYVKAVMHSSKTMNLSFDEWNVWYHSRGKDEKFMAKHPWQEAPSLLEEAFNMADALLVGGMLITLLHNADRVKIACLAQLINAIAPIMTVTGGPCWRQTTFYPLLLTSRFGRGVSLRPHMTCGRYDSKNFTDVPYVTAAAVHNEEDGVVTLFVLNRNLTEQVDFTACFHGFDRCRVLSHTMLRHDDLNAQNGPTGEAVVPIPGKSSVDGPALTSCLPAASWHAIRVAATPVL